jgi:hypothetical protein
MFEEALKVADSELVGLAVAEKEEDQGGFVVSCELTTEVEFQ